MILEDPKVEIEFFEPVKMLRKVERACRTCYKSEDKITEDSYKSLLKNCVNKGHESVLEHEKITVRLRCDVGVYKDLTRHRLASYSIESTRYCDYSKDKFDGELHFIKPTYYTSNLQEVKDYNLTTIWRKSMQNIEDNYLSMKLEGATPDEMRMILPHSLAADVVITANLREWKHILELRCSKNTHPAVQQVMISLLLKFKKLLPVVFGDIDYNRKFPKEKLLDVKMEEDL